MKTPKSITDNFFNKHFKDANLDDPINKALYHKVFYSVFTNFDLTDLQRNEILQALYSEIKTKIKYD